MTDRLNESLPVRREDRLQQGQPIKTLHAYALVRLARSEPKIIGSARRARIRDIAIGTLQAVTLLGAVLIPVLRPDPPENSEDSLPTEPQPITLVVSPPPVSTAQSPAEVNLDLNVAADSGTGSRNQFQVVGLQPVYVKKENVLVAGVAMPQDYWYRTELAVGDVFWALPDGQFFFEMMGFQGCATSSTGCSMTLNFAFNSGSLSARETGRLTFGPSGVAAVAEQDNSAVSCGLDSVEVYPISRTPYQPTFCLFNGLKVSLRQPEPDFRAVNSAGNAALEVKWCRPAGTAGCPLPAEN